MLVAAMIRTSAVMGLVPPQAVVRLRLQELEQLALGLGCELGDLVEEEGALVGRCHLAGGGAGRRGVGAALGPEQLALEQRRGQRRAVELHEGARGARAARRDDPGQRCLARPAGTLYQHGAAGCTSSGKVAVLGGVC